nr:hypothetical protein [Tanacetum cinerariifolium]
QLQALINRGVAAVLAERDADRSRNGDNNNDSATGGRRQMTTPRECSYTYFLKWKHLDMVELSHEGCWTGCCLCNAVGHFEKNDHRQVLPEGMFPEESAKQPPKRNNVARAYTAGQGDMKPYRGTKPLCPKCNYHHDGPCAPKCTKCKKIGHLARDCKGRPAANNNNNNNNQNNNNNNNNQKAQGATARGITCYEYGVLGHYKSDCPKLKNGNQKNRAGNGNDVAKAYAVGTAGTNP